MTQGDEFRASEVEPVPLGPGPCPNAPKGCPNLEDGNSHTGECLDCVDKLYAEENAERAVANYKAILDELLGRRTIEGMLSEEEEARYAEALFNCRRGMTVEEESRIDAVWTRCKLLSDLERAACLAEARVRSFRAQVQEGRRWRAALQLECPHEHIAFTPAEPARHDEEATEPPIRLCLTCKIAEEAEYEVEPGWAFHLLTATPAREMPRGELICELKALISDVGLEMRHRSVPAQVIANEMILRVNDIRNPALVADLRKNPEPLSLSIQRALKSKQPEDLSKTLDSARQQGRMEEWADAMIRALETP